MNVLKERVLPASLLAGTIIGAGIFSLPYAINQSGLLAGFLLLFFATLIFIITHLMYADLVIQNSDDHRFAGYARIYFGKFGYLTSVVMTVVEMFFVLTIYLTLSVSFSNIIFPDGNVLLKSVIFWALGSLIIFIGTKKVAFLEFLAVLGIVVSIAVIALLGLPRVNSELFSGINYNWVALAIPFAPLLFSLSGRPVIPSLMHYFKRIGKPLNQAKPAIVYGTIIPAIVYIIFVLGVLGISGQATTADTITGISQTIPLWAKIITIGLLGVASLLSSYFAIGLDVKNSLVFDLKIKNWLSSLMVISLPLILYLINLGSFLEMVEIAGGIFIGLEGLFILSMWTRSLKKRQPEEKYLISKKISAPIILLMRVAFIFAIVYVVTNFI